MRNSRMDQYNIEWNTQSEDSSESMPLGGHDAGCNVWVADNQICIYLAQSGAFDENGTMLKLGRIRLRMDDQDLLSKNFIQKLVLEKGHIEICAGESGEKVCFCLWQDVSNANLHISFTSEMKQKLFVTYDNWRYREREVVPEERGQCRNLSTVGEEPLTDRIVTYPDEVECQDQAVWFWHRNHNDQLVYDRAVRLQHLESVKEAFPNCLENRMMGGCMYCPDMHYLGTKQGEMEHTDQMEYSYVTDSVNTTEIVVSVETGQYESVELWKAELKKKQETGISQEENQNWWKQYFEKSFIIIDEKNPGSEYWKLGRNYQLFRYMLGCNYYGAWPTKFNGGLFTFYECFTPDYRNWSGCDFTAQNQRLVYWPMLKTGDFEAMKPQMDFYRNILNAGKMRAKHYWGLEGAYFPEQISCFGMSVCADYMWNRQPGIPDGEDGTPYVRMHYTTALEFALMMLAYEDYSGENITEYHDFIDNVIRFYYNHYEEDAHGKLRVFPSTSLETYKNQPYAAQRDAYGVTNPMDVAAGLKNLLEIWIRYGEKQGMDMSEYRCWYEKCPDLPIGQEAGKKVFLPAEEYNPEPFNCELPQLYRIFPYSYLGLSENEKEIGRNTYQSDSLSEEQRMLVSWHQNGIFAARLNMKEEAMRVAKFKLADSGRRFPAFWGPGHDWTPDHNRGGSAMIGLQEMLLQLNGDSYELLPAWDTAVDVHFRLFVPGNRTVECRVCDGRIEK